MTAPRLALPVSADWRAAVARLATAFGLPVPEYLARAELDDPAVRTFQCGSCERPMAIAGRYPPQPLRDPGDPYRIAYSIRVFEEGLVEVHGLDGDKTGYFCRACAKVWLEPLGRILGLLAPRELDSMGEHNEAMGHASNFLRNLFKPKVGPGGEPPKQLPPGK